MQNNPIKTRERTTTKRRSRSTKQRMGALHGILKVVEESKQRGPVSRRYYVYMARTHDMPAMIRYLDHRATANPGGMLEGAMEDKYCELFTLSNNHSS
ncbi:hypothetical protein TNCV_2781401 [Trichonephila clavipes]|nr:hypothetical protein TNCV_2781401 [Trichonephila clavipes]